jgi:hypothetical protein
MSKQCICCGSDLTRSSKKLCSYCWNYHNLYERERAVLLRRIKRLEMKL